MNKVMWSDSLPSIGGIIPYPNRRVPGGRPGPNRSSRGVHEPSGSAASSANLCVLEDHYRRYREVVRQAAMLVLACEADAEDVTHDVFTRLLARRPSLPEREFTRAYFCRAGYRAALNVLRARASERSMKERFKQVIRPAPPGPDRLLGRRELMREVITALDELPDRRRKVARLSLVDQCTAAEVAKELGIGVKRVERHRRKIREFLLGRLQALGVRPRGGI